MHSFAESLRFLLHEHVNPRLQICFARKKTAKVVRSLLLNIHGSVKNQKCWESFEVWQIKGDPIHKWRLTCWETWSNRHENASKQGKLKPEPARFLWHATDVNTGATSVTKAYQCSVLTLLKQGMLWTSTQQQLPVESSLSKLFRWWFWTCFAFTSTWTQGNSS